MSKTPQNMTESLNSLLSPLTYWLLGQQLVTKITNDGSSMFWSFPPANNEQNTSKFDWIINSLFTPINLLVARGNNW